MDTSMVFIMWYTASNQGSLAVEHQGKFNLSLGNDTSGYTCYKLPPLISKNFNTDQFYALLSGCQYTSSHILKAQKAKR